jgi:hypothetical protein
MKMPLSRRAVSTQTIRDRADDPSANDVDLAAEVGRLELELRLAMADGFTTTPLEVGLMRCRAAMLALVEDDLSVALKIIEEIRGAIACHGNRPTEPPSSTTAAPDHCAAAAP